MTLSFFVRSYSDTNTLTLIALYASLNEESAGLLQSTANTTDHYFISFETVKIQTTLNL